MDGRMTDRERIERAKQLRDRVTINRAPWIGCDGWFRIGHTDDMRQMLDDLGVPSRA
jgi:hypothetical protein